MSIVARNPAIPQVYIPENLVLPDEPVFRDYPEDALYLCHLLYRERIHKKRSWDEFHPIKYEYLRKQINKDAAGVLLNALIAHGIVESDRQYIVGKKAIGYRLREDLRHSEHHRYKLTDKALLRRLRKWYNRGDTYKSDLAVHLGLENHLRTLSIDADAVDAVERHYQDTIASLKGDRSGNASRKRRKALRKRNAELHAIDAWINGHVWFTVDDYGRVHTPFTSLSGYLRPHVVNLGKKPLVELDIVNSQPLILAALAIQFFRNKCNSFSLNEESIDLKLDLQKWLLKHYANLATPLPTPHPSPPRPLYDAENCKYSYKGKSNLPEDTKKFIQLCQSGTLYDELSKGIERKKAKKVFFKTIFGRKTPNEWSEHFPSVAQVTEVAKRDDYRHLSHLLQRTESTIMIHGVAAELIKSGRFVTTIHDSVIVEEQDVRQAKKLIWREFRPWGVNPQVRVKRIKECG